MIPKRVTPFEVTKEQLARWAAEERHFAGLAQCFIERKTKVHGIQPMDNDIGYTLVNKIGIAEIFVCRLHMIMQSLPDTEKSFFRLGVFAHEALHQIFTNFDETNRIIKNYKNTTERQLFADISNIVEDTRIEFFAHQAIGGEALSALQYTIKTVYLDSKLGKETSAVAQALNALIQLGDMGVIRGEFTFPQAFEIFSRIVPLFEKAVKMPVCADALQVSKEITDIVLEYVDLEFPDFLEDLFKSISTSKSSGSGKGSDADEEGEESDYSDGSGSSSSSARGRAKEILKRLGIPESSKTDDTASDEATSFEGDSKSISEPDFSSDSAKESASKVTDDGASSKEDDKEESLSSFTLPPVISEELTDIKSFEEELAEDAASEKANDLSEGEDSKEKTGKDKTSDDKSDDIDEDSSDDLSFDDEPCDFLDEAAKEALEELNTVLQDEFERMSEDGFLDVNYSEDISNLDEAIQKEIVSEEKKENSEKGDPYKKSIPESVQLDNDAFVKLLVNKKMPSVNIEAYNTLVKNVAPYIAATTKAVERVLKQETEEKERHTSGEVNLGRYHDVTYTSARVFDKRREPLSLENTCFTFLFDESASMSGSKELAARESAILLAEVCAKLKVPCYIAGYSADEIHREVDMRHYVTWKNAKTDRTSLVALRGRCENRDGASIRAITQISKKRKEERKILFVISDGQPLANDYYGKPAILDTKNAIREARKVYDVVIGISLGTADTNILHEMYGNDFVSVTKVAELPIELSKLFKKQFKVDM